MKTRHEDTPLDGEFEIRGWGRPESQHVSAFIPPSALAPGITPPVNADVAHHVSRPRLDAGNTQLCLYCLAKKAPEPRPRVPPTTQHETPLSLPDPRWAVGGEGRD